MCRSCSAWGRSPPEQAAHKDFRRLTEGAYRTRLLLSMVDTSSQAKEHTMKSDNPSQPHCIHMHIICPSVTAVGPDTIKNH